MEMTAELTGLFAAHALLTVSEGETLAPLLGAERSDGSRTLRQLAIGKPEELVAVGQRWLLVNPDNVRRGVLIYDGYITLEGQRTDALLLEAHHFGEKKTSFGLAIPYRNAGDPTRFTIFRPKFIALEDMGQERFQSLVEAFFRGVDQHERGARLWQESSEQSPHHTTERAAVVAM